MNAQPLGDALKSFLHDDAVATLHLRSMYDDRTNPHFPNYVAWAGGGWVGYETGWLYDILQLGGVAYTTQPLWAPSTTPGSLTLKLDQHGFYVLGQAYASIRAKDHVFTAYRQMVDELEVNPNDDRMIPNTFEAYALRGRLAEVDYFAGYVAAMKPRDYSTFLNMGERAGAPNADAGMGLFSLKYGSIDDLRLRGSAYYVPDILTSTYGDAVWTIPSSGPVKFQLNANLMIQGSNGLHRLTGKPFSTWSGGARGDMIWGPGSLWVAYTQTGSADLWRSPYGVWLGFTKQLVLDFDRANEKAFQIGATLDFAALNLPGLNLIASGTFGADALTPTTGAYLPQNTEYNFDLIYQVPEKAAAPDWLKPLQLRARAGYVEINTAGNLSALTEYRFILNYELKFRGRDY